MSNIRSRLSHAEKVLAEHDKEPDMLVLMIVPDDYPDPVPPGYRRESEVDKMDLSAYPFVLKICIPPDDYEERKRAAEAAKVRSKSTQTLPGGRTCVRR